MKNSVTYPLPEDLEVLSYDLQQMDVGDNEIKYSVLITIKAEGKVRRFRWGFQVGKETPPDIMISSGWKALERALRREGYAKWIRKTPYGQFYSPDFGKIAAEIQ